ncbi:hypothetical protein [Oceanospirillum sanctuarii]|nr:hypothetical protein [Oceanospirillum sanctuarii]
MAVKGEKHTGGLVQDWMTTNDDTEGWQSASAKQSSRSASLTGHET